MSDWQWDHNREDHQRLSKDIRELDRGLDARIDQQIERFLFRRTTRRLTKAMSVFLWIEVVAVIALAIVARH